MAGPIKRALVDLGYRVREYSPVGELLPGAAVPFIEGAAGSHHLDDVDAPADRLAHRAAAVVGPVADAAADDSFEELFAQVVIVGVTVGRAYRVAGGQNARSQHDAVADRVSQTQDGVTLRAEIAHRREASHEGRGVVLDSDDEAAVEVVEGRGGTAVGDDCEIIVRFAEVQIPTALRAAAQMHVQIDEAGHDEHVREVDDARVRRQPERRGVEVARAYLLDIALLYDHGRLRDGLFTRLREQPPGVDDGVGRGCERHGSGRYRRRQSGRAGREAEQQLTQKSNTSPGRSHRRSSPVRSLMVRWQISIDHLDDTHKVSDWRESCAARNKFCARPWQDRRILGSDRHRGCGACHEWGRHDQQPALEPDGQPEP